MYNGQESRSQRCTKQPLNKIHPYIYNYIYNGQHFVPYGCMAAIVGSGVASNFSMGGGGLHAVGERKYSAQ